MRPVFANTVIDAPREVVHELLLDLSSRPAYTDHFIEDYRLVRIDPVGLGAGARFRVNGTKAWMDSVIADIEAPYKITERGHSGRLNRVPTYTVWETTERTGIDGCELRITFWTEPASHFDSARERGLQRKMNRGYKRTAERIKALIEDGAPIGHVSVGGESRI